MKRLIVNADDFGLTEGVNRGIIECHRQGVVTNTTLLVNGRAAIHAARLAHENPELGVGLHVNLIAGPPVLSPDRVPSLVGPDGRFPGLRKIALGLTMGLTRKSEVEAEIAAQINRCRELGIEPTHVDSHRHLHAHPRLRAALYWVCRHANIKKARGYRMHARTPKALAIRLAAMVPVGGEGLQTPERFSGIEVMGSKDMAAALRRELAREGETLEFMCHPGYADEELGRASSYSAPRQVELEALVSGGFLEAVREAGAGLITFREL